MGLAMANGIETHGNDWRGTRFLGWSDLDGWQRSPPSAAGTTTLCSPELGPGLAWDELVVSWNIEAPAGTGAKVEARGICAGKPTAFYNLGYWSSDPARNPRESVPGQRDADGEVQTDTLVLRRSAERAQLRVTLTSGAEAVPPRVKFIGASFLARGVPVVRLDPNREGWGRSLSVPERSQVDYPEGKDAWCSPTSVSMVLGYWAGILKRPELDRDVPTVAAGVFDRNWPGTGNWPFNTAYAGMQPGLRAYVTRFSDVSELEDWVARGVPVIVSVCYDVLQGRTHTRESGHLVVCVGFTAAGEVVVNDPGTRVNIRRTFPRENLIRAWARSRNTVYLIYPEKWRGPRDRFGHWHTP